jgi:hypothetical protein
MTTAYLHERIEAARRGLVQVHKALIDVERLRHERIHGRIDGAGRLLQLVINDPAFAWVRPLSSLIVRMDALLADADALDAAEAEALIDHARRHLRPDPTGNEFAKLYDRALQESPDVVLAHGSALALLESVH